MSITQNASVEKILLNSMSKNTGVYAVSVKRRSPKNYLRYSGEVIAFSQKAYNEIGAPQYVQIAENLFERSIYIRPMTRGKQGWLKFNEFRNMTHARDSHWVEDVDIKSQKGNYQYAGMSGDTYKFLFSSRI